MRIGFQLEKSGLVQWVKPKEMVVLATRPPYLPGRTIPLESPIRSPSIQRLYFRRNQQYRVHSGQDLRFLPLLQLSYRWWL